MIQHDWHHRLLVRSLLLRRIEARYRGSLLGLLWAVLLPLAMLAVYTLVFNYFLKVRWPGAAPAGGLDTALQIYLGLIVFNYAAENLNSAPGLVIEHQQYVTKIVFPLPVLAYVAALSSLVPLLFGIGILGVFAAFSAAAQPLKLLALPLYWAPLLLWAIGVHWWLAALGVYVRDLGHLIGPFVTALMFLSPVFYAVAGLPEPWNRWWYLNPLSQPIEDVRHLLFSPGWPSPGPALTALLAAGVFALLGRRVFDKLKKGFADVL